MVTIVEKNKGQRCGRWGEGTGSGTLGLREGFTEKVMLEQRPEGGEIPVDMPIACKNLRWVGAWHVV